MGFLLVILAGVYGNWFPIIDGIICAIAHLPIVITKAISDPNDYDFNIDANMSSQGNFLKETGQFVSAFLIISGLYLPIILHNSLILTKTAMVLTIVGGGLIYGTVYVFSLFFDETDDEINLGEGVI